MTTTQRSKNKRLENWDKVFEFFGGRRCMVCGLESPHPIYQLHHHDREGKEIHLSAIMHHSWNKVEDELRKTILVCANCHCAIHDISRSRKK